MSRREPVAPLITEAMVMAELGVGIRTLYRLVREQRIPGVIENRKLRMTTGQFAQLQRDGIAPKPEPEEPPTPIDRNDFIRRKAS